MKAFRLVLAGLFFLWSAISAPAMLIINELNGFNVGESAVATPPSITFIGCTDDETDLTTYSYASHSIGTAGATRTVVVIAMGEDSTNDFSISSLSIGGNAAAEQTDTAYTNRSVQAALYTLAVAAGTTATISVTYSEAITSSTVCVWALYDLTSSTPTATAIDGTAANAGTPLTLSVNVSAEGVALAACVNTTIVSPGYTWTGMTERADGVGGTSANWTAADYTEDATPSSPLATTCTRTSGTGTHVGTSGAFR